MARVSVQSIEVGMRVLSVEGRVPGFDPLPATVTGYAGTTTVMDYLEHVYELDNGKRLYVDPGRSPFVTVED